MIVLSLTHFHILKLKFRCTWWVYICFTSIMQLLFLFVKKKNTLAELIISLTKYGQSIIGKFLTFPKRDSNFTSIFCWLILLENHTTFYALYFYSMYVQGCKFSGNCLNSRFHKTQIPALLFIFSPFWRLLAQIYELFSGCFVQVSLHPWYINNMQEYSKFRCVLSDSFSDIIDCTSQRV